MILQKSAFLDHMQMGMQNFAILCVFGCGLPYSFAFFRILSHVLVSFCIIPYNCADTHTDLCMFVQIWMQILALKCGVKLRMFAVESSDATFCRTPQLSI